MLLLPGDVAVLATGRQAHCGWPCWCVHLSGVARRNSINGHACADGSLSFHDAENGEVSSAVEACSLCLTKLHSLAHRACGHAAAAVAQARSRFASERAGLEREQRSDFTQAGALLRRLPLLCRMAGAVPMLTCRRASAAFGGGRVALVR